MRLRPTDLLLRACLKLGKAADSRDDALATLRPGDVRCLLLVSATALGDTVLSTAAFAPLRARFPGARIVALIERQYVALFRACPELDAVVPFHGGYARFLRTALALRRERPDLALVLHGNEPQATPLAYLSGARRIVKLPNANEFRFLLSNREPLVAWSDFRHALDQRLGVAALVGASVAGARMALPRTAEGEAAAERFLADAGLSGRLLVGLQCGASSRARMWPAAHFVELARRLRTRRPDCAFVLTGSPAEADYLRGIAGGIGPGAAVATGLPLPALPGLVARLRLLVTGDTGTLHVAVAVGTPIVGLFAVSTPSASGPGYDLDRHVVIHRPCPDLGLRSKSGDQECIARIGVEQVLDAVNGILERP